MIYTKDQLQAALSKSWTQQTSKNPVEWSTKNPARGQCAVSALIVQELLGGELQKVDTIFNSKQEGHFRNVINGAVIDTTRSQYPESQQFVESEINLHSFATAREKLLADEDTCRRYEILKSTVFKKLHK